jgi:hypothetical protein
MASVLDLLRPLTVAFCLAHRTAFNAAVFDDMQSSHTKMISPDKFGKIWKFMELLNGGGTASGLHKSGWTQAHAWSKKYSLVEVSGERVLLARTSKKDIHGTIIEELRQLVHSDNVFDAIYAQHVPDHQRHRNLYYRCTLKYLFLTLPLTLSLTHLYLGSNSDANLNPRYSNISQVLCTFFCDTCPKCMQKSIPKKRVTPGHNPILTYGFGRSI